MTRADSAPNGCGLLFSFQSLFYLLVSFCTCLIALKLRSLRFHSPRLCRAAVFLIQTNVSLSLQDRMNQRLSHGLSLSGIACEQVPTLCTQVMEMSFLCTQKVARRIKTEARELRTAMRSLLFPQHPPLSDRQEPPSSEDFLAAAPPHSALGEEALLGQPPQPPRELGLGRSQVPPRAPTCGRRC